MERKNLLDKKPRDLPAVFVMTEPGMPKHDLCRARDHCLTFVSVKPVDILMTSGFVPAVLVAHFSIVLLAIKLAKPKRDLCRARDHCSTFFKHETTGYFYNIRTYHFSRESTADFYVRTFYSLAGEKKCGVFDETTKHLPTVFVAIKPAQP